MRKTISVTILLALATAFVCSVDARVTPNNACCQDCEMTAGKSSCDCCRVATSEFPTLVVAKKITIELPALLAARIPQLEVSGASYSLSFPEAAVVVHDHSPPLYLVHGTLLI